ncbi:MAG: DNA primase [Dehalococcoidales bacterium]
MSVIDEVKQKIDIVEVVGGYTTLKKAGKNLTALCPFHTEKDPSFFIYPEQQSWHCFGACNTGGDVFSFVMKKENLDFGEALRLMAERAGVELPSTIERGANKDEKEKLYQVNKTAAAYFNELLLNSPAAKIARDYLERRGLTAETISTFQLGFSLNSWEGLKKHLLEIGYSGDEILKAGVLVESDDGTTHDRFRNRLMFPIADNRGRILGFGARVLDDSLPKYVNSPQTPLFDKSGIIYGLDLAAPAIRRQELAVLVEGYMDVIAVHQGGFNNVVAAMGTSVTERQILTLKRMTPHIALALDADSAGEEAMLRCVDYENSLDAEVKVIILPEGKDPDDVVRADGENWQRLVDEAVPVLDYTFDMITSRLDMTTASGQTLAVSRLGAIVLQIKDPIRQAHYKQKLARITDKDVRTIEMALGGMKPAPIKKQSKPVVPVSTTRPAFSHPIEEQCLALLLQHPEIKDNDVDLPPEYFENSENREIYLAWRQMADPAALKESLDPSIWDYVDRLMSKPILATEIDERYNGYIRRLYEEHLRGLERKKGAVFALEVELKGSGADLAKLEEHGVKESAELREIFTQKARKGREQRR